MLFNINDLSVGKSFDLYGEFSEGEVDLFRQIIKPGQIVVEVGANIGAHTIWLANWVGNDGAVLAIEPQRIVYQTLCANVALNNLTNVHCFHAAAGRAPGKIQVPSLDFTQTNNFGGISLDGIRNGEAVPVLTVDALNLSNCHFLKIDVEGMEEQVLEGSTQCIRDCRPVLYVENDREEKSNSLIRYIDSLGYTMYWHKPPLYNPNNFAGNPLNIFGRTVSINIVCLPKTAAQDVRGFAPVVVP